MKKLEKLTLKELSSEFNLIGRVEAQRLNGGYSWEEYEQLERNGEWDGGQVDGYGYISQSMYANADGPNTSLMDYGQLIQSAQQSPWSVAGDAATDAVMDWNPVTAYLNDAAGNIDNLLQITRQNQLNDALQAIWSDGCTDQTFSVTYYNGNFSVYDMHGNCFYQN